MSFNIKNSSNVQITINLRNSDVADSVTEGYIYVIRNVVNNKAYVGQTWNIERRLSQHFSAKGGSLLLAKAIAKYGSENFNASIVATCHTQQQMDSAEIAMIREFDTFIPKGYNLTHGGKGHDGDLRCLDKDCNEPVTYGSSNFCSKHLAPKLVLRKNDKGKVYCIGKDNSCPTLSRDHKNKLCIACGRKQGMVFNNTIKMLTTTDPNGNLV
jgi:group I intron endonuclease